MTRLSDESVRMLRDLFAKHAEHGATIFHQAHAEELLALAEEVIAMRSETVWISVKDRLPEKAGRYIVAIKPVLEDDRIVIFSRYVPQEHAAISGWREAQVTHWMPIPQVPK